MPSEPQNPGLEWRIDALLKAARDARDHFVAWRRARLGFRGTLLYVLSIPLAFATVVGLARGNLSEAMSAGAAFLLIVIGGYVNRRGMLEELIAPERRFTRSFGLPHKYLAALSVASGTMIAAQGITGHDTLTALMFALIAVVGFHLSYKLPKPRDLLGRQRQKVRDKPLQKALAQAERRILTIEKAAHKIGNLELSQRLRRIATQGREILDQIVARPDERFRARKFLNVYLEGAERVAGRYAQTHRLAQGQALEQNFRNVLIEIESVFASQLTQLAEHDVFDLDVQIEVLRKQLEREGMT